MTDTDKANALDWLNEIITNPEGWRMFYSYSETKTCAEAALALLKEQETEIRQLRLALDIAKGTCKGVKSGGGQFADMPTMQSAT